MVIERRPPRVAIACPVTDPSAAVTGPRPLVRALPTWFTRSVFAPVVDARTAWLWTGICCVVSVSCSVPA